MRASQLMLIAPMAVFGVAGVGLYLFFTFSDVQSPFHDNLVPELIGFCLEGFVFIGLLSLFQRSREQAYRRELWLSLRGALRGILSNLDIALLPPNAEPAPTHTLEQDRAIVPRFMRELQDLQLDLRSMLALKREAADTLELARDMLPVAAQLSARHMRWWIAIVHGMRQLSTAQTREQVEQSVYILLENIREFDNVSY